MNEDKIRFLKQELVPLVQRIPADTQPAWGKMSLQHMVEHLAAAVRVASGQITAPGTADPTKWERNRAFLMTEKPFKENTRNPFLPETPLPLRHHTLAAAINDLQAALIHFFHSYAATPDKKVQNLIFGELGYAEQVQLLYKHGVHHLRQFGVTPTDYVS